MKDKGVIITIVIAVMVIAVSIISAMKYTEKTETEIRTTYEKSADSIASYYSEKQTEYEAKITSIQAEMNTSVKERDSLREYVYTNTKSTKQLVRTVYKDSIKEVYVENTEAVTVYENTISKLRDSISNLLAKQDGVEVKYVEKIVHDTIVSIKTQIDSVYVSETTQVKKDTKSNWGVYADGHIGYGTNGMTKGANAGGKYYVIGPVYGRLGVSYDGSSISGEAGVGLDYRF